MWKEQAAKKAIEGNPEEDEAEGSGSSYYDEEYDAEGEEGEEQNDQH